MVDHFITLLLKIILGFILNDVIFVISLSWCNFFLDSASFISIFAAFISTVAAANISAHYTTGFKTDKPTIFQAIQATYIAALLSTVSSSNNAASITTIQATKLSAI